MSGALDLAPTVLLPVDNATITMNWTILPTMHPHCSRFCVLHDNRGADSGQAYLAAQKFEQGAAAHQTECACASKTTAKLVLQASQQQQYGSCTCSSVMCGPSWNCSNGRGSKVRKDLTKALPHVLQTSPCSSDSFFGQEAPPSSTSTCCWAHTLQLRRHHIRH